jgi:hypothetical protein
MTNGQIEPGLVVVEPFFTILIFNIGGNSSKYLSLMIPVERAVYRNESSGTSTSQGRRLLSFFVSAGFFRLSIMASF